MNKSDLDIEKLKNILPFSGFSKKQIIKVFGNWENHSKAINSYVKKFLAIKK